MQLQIESNSDNFIQYDGVTPEDVLRVHREQKSSWTFNLFSWKKNQLKLDPFNQSCIGIASTDSYKIKLNIIRKLNLTVMDGMIKKSVGIL